MFPYGLLSILFIEDRRNAAILFSIFPESLNCCIYAKIQGLEEYAKKCKENLIKVARNSNGNMRPNCGSMLVTEPNVVWRLFTVLVVAIVFVTTTLASGCLLCPVPCPRCVWKIHGVGGGWHNSAGYSSDGQVIWVARLSSNSKNSENPLFNNKNKKSFLLKHVWETINNKQMRFAFLANRRRKNIERGRVTMGCV